MLDEMSKNITLISIFLFLIIIEKTIPFFKFKNQFKHNITNISLFIINSIIVKIFLFSLILFATKNKVGFFYTYMISYQLLISLILLDLITFWLHVAYHKVPFMWKLHKLHHSDNEMNVTTSFRFHIGELAFSIIIKSIVIVFLGIKLEHFLLYETLFLTNVMFQHSNLSIGKFDKVYRFIFTSPDMHKVHHSNIQEETDSNYTSLLSVWDRIFKTYKENNPKKIVFGVRGLENEQTLKKMLLTPLK